MAASAPEKESDMSFWTLYRYYRFIGMPRRDAARYAYKLKWR